jgi:hypothetical protein
LDLTENLRGNLINQLKQNYRPQLSLPKILNNPTKIWKTTRFYVQDP